MSTMEKIIERVHMEKRYGKHCGQKWARQSFLVFAKLEKEHEKDLEQEQEAPLQGGEYVQTY